MQKKSSSFSISTYQRWHYSWAQGSSRHILPHPINFIDWMTWKLLQAAAIAAAVPSAADTADCGVPWGWALSGLLTLPQRMALLCHPQGTDDRAPSDPGLVWGSRVQGLISRAKFRRYILMIIVLIEQELFLDSMKHTKKKPHL